jgi:hypothetical protein
MHSLGLAAVLTACGAPECAELAAGKPLFQSSDWRERPLQPDALQYARLDTHYLLPLWRLLSARVTAAGLSLPESSSASANGDSSSKVKVSSFCRHTHAVIELLACAVVHVQ